MRKAAYYSTGIVLLVWTGLALGVTLQEDPPRTLTADATDLNPITFTIVNSGGDPAVPDVIVSGADSGNGTYLDIGTIVGRAGPGDTIAVAIDAATNWSLTGLNAGTVAIEGYSGIIFSGIDHLVGAAGEDTFIFPADVAFGGTIDGGLGAGNTLDYSARATSVTVNLASQTATGTNGIANIQNVIGGAGADMLTGDSQDNVFTGGPGKDTINGGGGGGLDTLVETRDADFTLSNTSLIAVIGGVSEKDTLSGIGAARLTGGPGNNLLNATNFSGSVVLDGAGGNDTLRGGSGNDLLIGGAGDDDMYGGLGDDEYRGGPGVNTLTEALGGGVDTVVETCDADFTLTDTGLLTWSEGTDTLVQIENVHLIGGPGDNNFTLSAPAVDSIRLEGGADGTDTLALTGGTFLVALYTFTNAHAGSIDLDGSVITYTDLDLIDATTAATDIVLNYGNADETITITDAGSGRTAVASTAGATATLSNPFGSLTLDAGGGNDTVDLNGLGSGFTADLMIEGNTGYDALTLGPQGVEVGLITGGIIIPGLQSVSYETVEALTIDDDVVVCADVTLTARKYNLRSLLLEGSTLTLASDVSATGFQGVTITTSYDLTVAAGSLISADGQGYPGGQGPGVGATASTAGTYYGGGGGYGGQGGDGEGGAQGGGTYGSSNGPTDLGSGGGYGGGAGGGAVRLVVNETLLLGGGIVCQGTPGGYHAGGGSGGSIYLTAGTLAGAGTIAADGGSGGQAGGGGGGGRIAIYYDTDAFSGTMTASGGAGFTPGGTGTILVSDASVSPEDCLERSMAALRGLAASDFANARAGNALLNKLKATIELIDAGLHHDALMKLQHDLLPKIDGCAVTGQPDKNDWIITCEAQQRVHPLVLQAMQLLENLI